MNPHRNYTDLCCPGNSRRHTHSTTIKKSPPPFPLTSLSAKALCPPESMFSCETGANTLLIRSPQGRSLVTVVTGPVQASEVVSSPKLRFASIAGRHVLVQVWSENDLMGSELYRAHSLIREAMYPAIHGTVAGRRLTHE